jgi:hypothetical protein
MSIADQYQPHTTIFAPSQPHISDNSSLYWRHHEEYEMWLVNLSLSSWNWKYWLTEVQTMSIADQYRPHSTIFAPYRPHFSDNSSLYSLHHEEYKMWLVSLSISSWNWQYWSTEVRTMSIVTSAGLTLLFLPLPTNISQIIQACTRSIMRSMRCGW